MMEYVYHYGNGKETIHKTANLSKEKIAKEAEGSKYCKISRIIGYRINEYDEVERKTKFVTVLGLS